MLKSVKPLKLMARANSVASCNFNRRFCKCVIWDILNQLLDFYIVSFLVQWHRFMAFQRTLYTGVCQATNDVHAYDPIRVPSTINRILSRKQNTQPSLVLWQIDPMLLRSTTLCMGNARRCQQRPLPAQRWWRGDLSVRNKHGADGVVSTDPALLQTARHVA